MYSIFAKPQLTFVTAVWLTSDRALQEQYIYVIQNKADEHKPKATEV